MPFPRLPLLFIIASLATACGSEPPQSSPSTQRDAGAAPPTACAPNTLDAPAAELDATIRAQCTRQISCGIPFLNTAATVEACVAERTLALDDYARSLATRGSRVSAENACLCRVGYEEAACGALRRTPPTACGQLVVGPGAQGDDCAFDFDCSEGLVCLATTQCPGTCVEIPPRCTVDSCGAEAKCDFGTGRCDPLSRAGEECTVGCVEGLFCGYAPGETPMGPPTCLPPAEPGARCIGAEGSCVSGYTCQGSSGVPQRCAPALGLDDMCSSYTDCADDLFCDFDVSRCRPRSAIGEACKNFGRHCVEGLYCASPAEAECGPDRPCGTSRECCQVDGRAQCVPLGGTCAPLDGTCAPLADYAGPDLVKLAAGDDCRGGRCPLGTTCRLATETATVPTCADLFELGEACNAYGTIDPYVCRTGICDVFASMRCVELKLPGEACTTDAAFTLECGSLMCDGGVCAPWDSLCRAP